MDIYIPRHFVERDLNAWVDVKFFKGRRKFLNGHCGLIPLQFFFIFIPIKIKVPLILHTKFQPNIFSCSGGNCDFKSFAIY